MRGPEVAVPGHFGEFLQGRLGPEGPVTLVTVPCPAVTARAARIGLRGCWVRGDRLFGPATYRRFFAALGIALPGAFRLDLDAPPGLGAGMSTAALVALAHAAGIVDPMRIAAACLAAEGAVDPVMHAKPARLLWASRRAVPLALLPTPPRFDVVGAVFGAPTPTDAADDNFPDIAPLVADWCRAAKAGDRRGAARIASQSAEATQALRGMSPLPLAEIARETGALGYCIAHTGALAAFLFAPGAIPPGAAAIIREAGGRRLIRFRGPGR